MFTTPRDSSPCQRNPSRSPDDHSSTKDKPRSLFLRYVHDLSISSQSLVTTGSLHDDLPASSVPTHAFHTASAQSTPLTSPSTGRSSLFLGSLSSATSESLPNTDSRYQSEFGLLNPASSSTYSPIRGSVSPSSSQPVSPRSRSMTESDSQPSGPRTPYRYPSGHFSPRPSTAPHSPLVSSPVNITDSSPVEHHTRSHSRLTISIKNLLSRSAIPSPSRFSFSSVMTMPSESEASSRSPHVLPSAGRWPMTPRKSRPPDLEIPANVTPAIPSPSRISNAPMDTHRVKSKHRHASEAVARTYDTRTGNGLPTRQESLDVSAQNVPLSLPRGREPKTRNVLRRRPSGSAKLFHGRERGMNSPSCPREGDADNLHLPPKEDMSRGEIPFPLTAAGAVVEAYKQQELYCNDFNPPKLSIEHRMSSSASLDDRFDRDCLEHSPTPYHRVSGSLSGRGAQVSAPDDLRSGFKTDQYIGATPQATSLHRPSASEWSGRSISRKVSSRWRKLRGGGVEESPSRAGGHSDGRPSLQEMWGVDKSGTRSTGRSIDGVPNAGGGAWANPIEGSARSGSEKSDGSEGGKLWRLMQRISSGGLRDRFQSDKVVPPVPAIPKELLEKVEQDERSNKPISPSRHQPSPSLRNKDHIRMSTASKNIAVIRPSIATTSSSPISSDIASTQFFYRTHSARSSVSSYGDAVVVPHQTETVVDQHIITPLEQLRLADDRVKSGEPGTSSVLVPCSPCRSTSLPVGLGTVEDAEDDYVPLPSPRRQTCSGESPSRPSSASGSARASYQGRGLDPRGSRMVNGIVSLSPPPRPPKSSRRGGGESMAGSPLHSMAVKQVDSGIGMGGVRQMDRMPSMRSDKTARLESPEPGGSEEEEDPSAFPHPRTQLTFRELDGPRRPPLSEREKAVIWDDLLARSDQAGGTLHINGAAELMSDSMRFSTHSET